MAQKRNRCPHCIDGVACWKILTTHGMSTPVRCNACNGTGRKLRPRKQSRR